MHDTTIAAKLLKQLESFSVRISPHFHKPAARFIGDMVYGIMAEGEGREALVRGPRAQGGNHPEKGRGQAQPDALVRRAGGGSARLRRLRGRRKGPQGHAHHPGPVRRAETLREEDGAPRQGLGREQGRGGRQPRLLGLHGRSLRIRRPQADSAALQAVVCGLAGVRQRERRCEVHRGWNHQAHEEAGGHSCTTVAETTSSPTAIPSEKGWISSSDSRKGTDELCKSLESQRTIDPEFWK